MSSRATTVAAIAGAIVIVAVLSLFALRSERAGLAPGISATPIASASPAVATASATATTASSPATTPSPTASPSATAAGADRYGYVFATQEGRISVRRERDAAPPSMQGATSPAPGPAVFELAGILPTVSVDGRRLAYWRTTPDVGATDLRVLDVADPTSDRSVLTLSGQTIGGDVVWSNDGQGLLVATYSRERVSGGGTESCPAQSGLLLLDLATTPPATRSAGSGGCALIPVAWDRPGQIAAAVVTGPGGYATEYVTWSGRAATSVARTPMPRPLVLADRVRASADAKRVLAIEDSLTALRVWPIEDVTRADTVRHPLRIQSAFWRGPANPLEVIWTVGNRVEMFRYGTESSTVLYTSAANVAAVAARPDGSAVLVNDIGAGPPPPTTRLLVVDIGTRQATEIATTVGGVHPLFRGVLLR